MWSIWAPVRFTFLRRFPFSVKQTEYLPIPSEPDHHEWPQRSQRMIPQKLPLAFFSSQLTSASAPGVGRFRQSRALS